MSLINILTIVFVFIIFIIIILSFVLLNIIAKEKREKSKSKDKKTINGESKSEAESVKTYKEYTLQSIFNFMEFDKIEDNMIVQKNGKKFLMAIECQGINYDLMSEIEKNSVEVGFMKVLNTLRTPIQIYIQTRTINLEDSLNNYKTKLNNIENELRVKQLKYKQLQSSGNYSVEQLTKQKIEVMKQENLYAYTKDIILNTEKMSLNKNILRKKYYIMMSYFGAGVENEDLSYNEIKDMAFSDLYTRSQSMIRSLASTDVIGKVLNSEELVDLLYNAYNRDEAETFGINKAREAEFDELYITAQDVLEKKMTAINKKIEERAVDVAEEAVLFAMDQKEIEEKEENMDDLINEFAKKMIDENETYLGKEVTEKAKKRVDQRKKGGVKNAKKTTRTRN